MKVENITKVIEMNSGFRIKLFENLSFDLEEGKITGIVAPSASGKSCLMELLAGLNSQEEVSNKINNSVFIPSLPSSFPWLDVAGNINFGKPALSKDELKSIINLVGLEGYENHFPNNKSLGFRFRISLARSLAVKPSVILIDEPFNKMDYQTKFEMYQLLLDVNKNLGITILLATSNLAEGILLSHKIHLMKKEPLEIIKTLKCSLEMEDINRRKNSAEYLKCLKVTEEILQEKELHQSFIISI